MRSLTWKITLDKICDEFIEENLKHFLKFHSDLELIKI